VLAVETRALVKSFRGPFAKNRTDVLRGIDLAVPAGTAFGLIGPNGAGKTTFIKTLLGICHPTAGTVRLFGRSPEAPAIRARIGYLPERLDLPASWTPTQYLRSVGRLKGLTGLDGEMAQQLERVGMTSEARRRTGSFSKGMRQRVGLAQRCWVRLTCSFSTSRPTASTPSAESRSGKYSGPSWDEAQPCFSTRTCSLRPSEFVTE